MAALEEMDVSSEAYQVELVGMYGYYYLKLAEDSAQIEHAVILMEAANKTMEHPVLAMKIIEGHQQLGQTDLALERARQLALALPDNEKVQALLASLEAS